MNNALIENSEYLDIVMPMYDLSEYIDDNDIRKFIIETKQVLMVIIVIQM